MIYVAFFAGAIGALGGAVAVIALRNPFYSVLALVVHLVSLAGLFLLLHAQFIAAAQVVVYAGAVMVLYVFVAAYVGAVEEPIWEPIPGQRFLGAAARRGALRRALDRDPRHGPQGARHRGPARPRRLRLARRDRRALLLERFLVVFEAASMLLLVAAVGAIVLAGQARPARLRRRPRVDGRRLVPRPLGAPVRDRRRRAC